MSRPRLLAVRQDNNGDVLLAGPAIRALARDANVTLLCGPGGAAAAHLLPGVDCVIVSRAEWIEGNPRRVDRAATNAYVELIAGLRIDEAFIFTSFHQSALPAALLLRLAGVPAIHAISIDYPGSLLDTRVRVDDDIHEVDRALAIVRARGIDLPPGDDASLQLRLPPLRRRLGLPHRYIAIQPGATVLARAWAPEKHRALVARLHAAGRDAVVLGSRSERALTKFVAGDAGIDLGGATSFGEFATVVKNADALVVANSSGIHVASAMKTPVVSIFPPTIPPVRFAPWRVPHRLLGDHGIACRSCRARVCPVPGQPCIGQVSIEDVVGALDELSAGARAA